MEYKDNLINFDLKSFLEKYSEKDIIGLKKKFPENYILLAEQLKLYPKAKVKLPEFTLKFCFFTTKSYEQSSSEVLAGFKAGLFNGKMLIDLTGGLGADDWGFSKTFDRVISTDRDSQLNILARINFQKLGALNIERIDTDAEEYIKDENLSADLIYIDADRRSKNKKALSFEDAEPNVLRMIERLFEISGNILLKLSPLIDITYISKSLKYIQNVYVISLDNDVKEILVLLDSDFHGACHIEAVNISKGVTVKYSALRTKNHLPEVSAEGKYFYEPGNSLIKSGLVNNYAYENNLNLITKNGVYLTGDKIINNFFGRRFKIITFGEFSKSQFKKYLTENKITRANLSARNFPLKPEELLKIFKLKEGGEEYFFFTQTAAKQKVFYHCRK